MPLPRPIVHSDDLDDVVVGDPEQQVDEVDSQPAEAAEPGQLGIHLPDVAGDIGTAGPPECVDDEWATGLT